MFILSIYLYYFCHSIFIDSITLSLNKWQWKQMQAIKNWWSILQITFASCSYLAALASLLFTHSKTFSLLKLLIFTEVSQRYPHILLYVEVCRHSVSDDSLGHETLAICTNFQLFHWRTGQKQAMLWVLCDYL